MLRARPTTERSHSVAARLVRAAEGLVGGPLGVHLRAWDDSEAGGSDGGTVVFRNRRALRRILWAPNELGLVRGFVTGDIDFEGDIIGILDQPEIVTRFSHHTLKSVPAAQIVRAVATLAMYGGIGRPPAPPSTEIPAHRYSLVHKHSRSQDAQAVSHHYDVSNDFYRLILGPSLVYSCAYWRTGPDGDLEAAQADKLDLICRKLALQPGMRMLDIGCGWGSLAIHAAREYGVTVVGVTLSAEQRALATERVQAAGLATRVEIRLQDYRDVADGPFDAVASVGMSEHVGQSALGGYVRHAVELLRPGGRFLNHAISTIGPLQPRRGWSPSFIERYIFPDGEILPVSVVIDAMEKVGADVRDAESLREHYGLTLRAWVANLRENWPTAVELVGVERARTWLLYLATCALAFERGRVGIHQVLAVKLPAAGTSDMAWTRESWITR